MRLIGLTGGIGSGKSTVAGIFMTLGIPIYDSDAQAKSLMTSNDQVKSDIIRLLGDQAYTDDHQLNRSWIASQVFADRDKLDKLNAIVHPAVFSDLVKWASLDAQSHAPYMIQESAILFEENLTDRFDAIILVVADQETRIRRIIERDKVSREQLLKRMSHQWSDEKKIPLSDYVIFNDSERSLISQVTDIDKMIRATIPNSIPL